MPISLYNPGVANARRLINRGDVNRSSSWSMSAADENRILGDPPNWTKYGSWHLGRETSENRETKAAWRYPFGRSGRVYRSALIAIRQRAGQQGQNNIFDAAGRLLNLVDNEDQAMVRNWYDIRAQGSVAEIWLYGDIAVSDETNPFSNEISAKSFIDELNALKVSDITLRIHSRGGGVFQGMAIYQALLRHPAQIHAEIDVIAGSIASVIPMAADYVTIADTAQFMIHNPWTVTQGNSNELRKAADDMDVIREGMVTAYMRRYKGTREELIEAMGKESIFTAAQTMALGFADDIYTPDMRVAAHFIEPKMENEPTTADEFNKDFVASAEPVDIPPPSEPENTDMTTEVNAAGPGGNVADIEAKIAANILAKDKTRRQGIADVFAKFPAHAELMRECQDNQECQVAQAQAQLLGRLGEDTKPRGGSVRIDSGEDERTKFRSGAVQALLNKIPAMQKSAGDMTGNEYRGATLVDLARTACEQAGIDIKGKDRMAVVKAAISGVGTHGTSDFDNLLEDTINKTMMNSYQIAPDTWRQFCAVGSVSDFRAHSRLKIGSFSNLTTVHEGGEYQYGTMGDAEKETITATTKGRLIAVTRQLLVNDDLSQISSMAQAMGRAAARSVEADVYATLALNTNAGPTMTDTIALFNASHNNVGTGGVITAASLDEARRLMTAQTDPDGNDYLDIMPSVLLVPEEIRATAIKIVGAEWDPDETSATGQNIPNPIRNMVSIVSTQRLNDNTQWYVFADPNLNPCLEVAFLDGNQSPFLDQEDGFHIDGITYKVRLDYGVGAVDYRSAVKNAGV